MIAVQLDDVYQTLIRVDILKIIVRRGSTPQRIQWRASFSRLGRGPLPR